MTAAPDRSASALERADRSDAPPQGSGNRQNTRNAHTTTMLDRTCQAEAGSMTEGGVEEGCQSAGRQDDLRFRNAPGVIDVR